MHLFSKLQEFIRGNIRYIVVGGVFTLLGVGLCAVYAGTLDYVASLDFCAHSCHEMESTVYQEYSHSKHFKNEQGVVVVCAQCHVPQNHFALTFGRKVLATFELWNHFVDQEYKLENFDKRRPYLAKKVLADFASTNARECKACHQYKNMILDEQRPSIRAQHVDAMKIDQNCLECHKGVTHDMAKEGLVSTTPAKAGFDIQ